MADVHVEVAGRSYRLACEDGEEGHLRQLAAELDAEARKLTASLRTQPEEGRLMLMLALLMADRRAELAAAEATRAGRTTAAEAEAEAARAALAQAEARIASAEERTGALEDRVAELEAALAEAADAAPDPRIAELEATLSGLRGQYDGARAALLEAGERVATLEEEHATLRREADRLERALAAAAEAEDTRASTAAPPPDLFSDGAARERARRIARLAERIEHLTDQISYHGGEA